MQLIVDWDFTSRLAAANIRGKGWHLLESFEDAIKTFNNFICNTEFQKTIFISHEDFFMLVRDEKILVNNDKVKELLNDI